ncbi:hypothetical protein NAS2_0590 [Conexivisphaera calida]|uniref:Uncharacterized protein n=1 Tax=Conexivisphaera calida TaxID=1874277 RepID=A0A4P2VBS1_9ARCH|nr:hypothetical protein NAS2_0590 [Conexivisphaera calida]
MGSGTTWPVGTSPGRIAAALSALARLSPCASTTTNEPMRAARPMAPRSPSRSVTITSGTTPLERSAVVASSAAISDLGKCGHPPAMSPAHRSSEGPAPTTTAGLPLTIALSLPSPTVLGMATSPSAAAAATSARGFSPSALAIAAYDGSHDRDRVPTAPRGAAR